MPLRAGAKKVVFQEVTLIYLHYIKSSLEEIASPSKEHSHVMTCGKRPEECHQKGQSSQKCICIPFADSQFDKYPLLSTLRGEKIDFIRDDGRHSESADCGFPKAKFSFAIFDHY
ncbi:hypothetical protein TNIN_473351 [Trichonephila inaurata madagascariensis]|uniref:Uncharacterized protein n=1 Tax=Trichonephila inaurata madagascariensis TaxID=2747483 RepID=A0A8X6X5J8_9ARAC|nr:hypothetical protein TNIN_473351 [Trichonephila inaurata madagascariensis]